MQNDWNKALKQFEKDRDICTLGYQLADFILRSELSISDQAITLLPLCAQAIRERGGPNDQDTADILYLKYLMKCKRHSEAEALARKCIEHNPSVPYFYYVVTTTGDSGHGLRYAKMGLRCSVISSARHAFVRTQLMHRAIDHAGYLACISPEDYFTDSEYMSLLATVLEEANVFIEEAPPDSWYMKHILYWKVILSVVVHGTELGGDLSQLEVRIADLYIADATPLRKFQDTLDKIKLAEGISSFLGIRIPNTCTRLIQRLIVDIYPLAIKEWSPAMQRLDLLTGLGVCGKVPEAISPSDLSALLDKWYANHVTEETTRPEGEYEISLAKLFSPGQMPLAEVVGKSFSPSIRNI